MQDMTQPEDGGGQRLDLVWPLDPGTKTAPQVALDHLQQLVTERLRRDGVTPETLHERIGGSVLTWRAKLSGARRFTLEDLLALLMGQDSEISELAPLKPATVKDLIPSAYWDWLSHTALNAGVPAFRAPAPEATWTSVAGAIEQWWAQERVAGRDWAITADVLVHRLLATMQGSALKPSAAARQQTDASNHILEWISASTRVHVHWSHDLEQRSSPALVREMTAAAGEQLWIAAQGTVATKIFAFVGLRAVRENLADALDVPASSSERAWFSAGITQAHRLGLEALVPEIQLQLLHRSGDLHVDWYSIK